MKKKLLDRRGAAIELAIMMMVFSIFITTIVLTTALLQNSHKAKAELGIKQDIFLEQLGEDFVDAVLSGKLENWEIEYDGITLNKGTVVKHIWVKGETVQPTCEAGGYTLYTCTLCNKTKIEDERPAVDHALFSDSNYERVPPNCTNSGRETGVCGVCHQTISRVLPAEHKWEETVQIPPNCTDVGYKTLACSECQETKESVIIPALGHNHGESDDGTIKVSPTCTQNGVISYRCTVCGTEYEQEIEVTGHNYGEYVVTKDPTETEHGKQEKVCVCGDKQIEDAHYWVDGETVEATCSSKGMKTQSCTVCGETQTLEIETTQHSFVDNVCTACGINKEEVRYNLIVLQLTKDAYMLHTEQVSGDDEAADEETQNTTDVTDISDVCSSGGTVVLKITISQIAGTYKITEWSKK